jgi:hypothetical protein
MSNRPHFIDGKLKIPSRATVHDCMDFFHGVKEDSKETQAVRWTLSKCLVRVDADNGDVQMKMSSTQMVTLKSEIFATVDGFGVGQYGYNTPGQSNKIDAAATFDQACSNFWFAVHHCIAYNAALLKKVVWKSAIVEEFIADEEKDGKPLDVFKYLRYKGLTPVAPGAPYPVNAPLLSTRLQIWVHADKSIAKEKQPKKQLNTSYYGGGPYIVSNGAITSNYISFSQLTAAPYIKRIDAVSGMMKIEKGDLSSSVVRFTGTPSVYSAASKGDTSFPNVMLYNLRLMPFNITVLSRTVSGSDNTVASADEIERMKGMGAIIPEPQSDHLNGDDHDFHDDELSDTERETKRQKTDNIAN